MKTFFATFAAILCAAAVIWGVYAYKLEQDEKAARNLETLQSTVKVAALSAERWSLSGASDPTMNRIDLESFARFEVWAKKPLPRDARLSQLRDKIVTSYRTAIALAMLGDEAAKAWGKEMAKRLDEMEARMKAAESH